VNPFAAIKEYSADLCGSYGLHLHKQNDIRSTEYISGGERWM
jgi:hypothetical protein